MGWSSATDIFDNVVGKLLVKDKPVDVEDVIRTLFDNLEDADWDTQEESRYWKHPIVRKVVRELHPDWEFPWYDQVEESNDDERNKAESADIDTRHATDRDRIAKEDS